MVSIFGSTELRADVQAKDLCISCGACVSICPYFKTYQGKIIQVFPCTLPEGRCYAHCPKAEVDLNRLFLKQWETPYSGEPLGVFKEIFASRAAKTYETPFSQAGGTVSALVAFALQEKTIDAAVLTDRQGLVPVPRLVTDPGEVAACAGSKFMASPTLSALNEGISKGFRKIGIVGTPCQMMAARKIGSNPLNQHGVTDPVALSIGLFCNWSLDTRKLFTYLESKIDISRIQGMDIPPPPADTLVIKTDGQDLEFALSEIKPFILNGCFICPDMTSEFADLSVGMYEGRSGWNTLIVRSQNGADFVRRAEKKGVLEVSDMPKETIAHLSSASAGKKQRAVRLLNKKDLLNTRGREKRSALRIPLKAIQTIEGREVR